MAVARKGSLNARQRARLAVQAEQDKIKRQVDLFTEALTAVDDRDEAEIRLGHALNELRGMGLSRADIAERAGLTSREVSAAMRAVTEATAVQDVEDAEETEKADGDLEEESGSGVDVPEDMQVSDPVGDNQDVASGTENDTMRRRSGDAVYAP